MGETALLVLVGLLIGLLLGSVGGGGSLIAVPALIYVGDQGVRGAQAGALLVVIVASATGFASYLSRGEVRWRAGLAFGLAAAASSFAGSLLSRHLDPDVLLLAFSPVMVAGAVAMVAEANRTESDFRPWRFGVSVTSAKRVTLFGLGVGWLTGLFGVGGGFLIVPVLVAGLGFALTEAVGTSLLVMIISSFVALAERLHGSELDWVVIGPFTGAAVVGVLCGSVLGMRTSNEKLIRGFAVLIVATAIYTGGQSLATLL